MKQLVYNGIHLFIPERYCIPEFLDRFKHGAYEKDDVAAISSMGLIHNCLELGSCVGYTSAILSRKAKNVVSVEANPEMFPALDFMRRENNIDNLIFVNCMVDSESTSRTFYTYDLAIAGSADRDDREDPDKRGIWKKNIRKYEVPCKTIEDLEKCNNGH